MGFRSGFERTIDSQLKSSGVNYKYESDRIPYIIESEYIPDFYFPELGFYVEVKGLLDYPDRRKHLIIKKARPDLDIRFCFMEAHKKMPGTKTTHAAWATKNGYIWCDGRIPEEWFEVK